MSQMRCHILVASIPNANDGMSVVLSPHRITFVTTLAAALAALASDSFDLIMIGVYFDESRMFELLNGVRRSNGHALTPVICFRTVAMPDGPGSFSAESVATACQAAGASAFFDLVGTPDGDDGQARISALIEQVLGGRTAR